jgi:hypothetical protein
MKLSANFTLSELTKSQTAIRHGIPNEPNADQIDNLKQLCINILQPIRSEFDKPVIISSAFRTAELCLRLGSSINSQHTATNGAAAADFEIFSIPNQELALWIKNNLEYDQLILEFHNEKEPNSGWIHCSFSVKHNRNQSLIAYRDENGKVQYKPW